MKENTGLRSLLWAAVSVVATIAVMVMLVVVLTPPANAETPAERCKRETTAYNNAWKNTWAQANPGKSPSQAPPPPVPYKCGGNDAQPPSVQPTTPDATVEPTSEPLGNDSSASRGDGPNMDSPTDRRELEHPDNRQSPIKGAESNEREQYLRKLVHRVMEAADRFKEFNLLSEVEKVDFVTTMRPVKVRHTADQQERVATGCWTDRKRQGWDSRWGYTVYTIWLGFKWCARNGTVTSVEIYEKGGETGTPGYDYEGIQAEGTKPAGWEARAYIQAAFSLYDVGGVGALPSIRPCLKGIGFADGMVTWRSNPDGESSCNNLDAPA